MNRFDNIDCMIGMKEYPDKYFDLAIVDPPYGIEITKQQLWRIGLKGGDWDKNIPEKIYFSELFRVSKNQIIWGGNYFIEHLKNTKSFMGFEYVGFELDKDYYEAACKRLEQFRSQLKLAI